MIKENESVTLAWCDNGLVDGKFTEGIVNIILSGNKNETPIHSSVRVQGNQIARQRQVLFDAWADQIKTDWLLWIDSDIVITLEVLKKIWESADSKKTPIVCGTYFISKENEGTLMSPFPALFMDNDEYLLNHIHPLPENSLIKIDVAGMGLVLMHKSIINKLRKKFPEESMFMEKFGGNNEKFVSEDVVFFRKLKQCKIPVHAHTGALVQHMKRFSLDHNYYNAYWGIDTEKY